MMLDSDSDDVLAGHFGLSKPEEEEESLLRNNEAGDYKKTQSTVKNPTKYPKSVFLILGTEFCERFNYYGMKTILVIYLTEWLGLAYHSAVALFHLFSMLAYFSPLLGAIIADGYLGRYRTIFYISIVYGIGTLVIALTALPPPEIYGPVIGLLLVSLGTGGIKPCVTAFGGDQFSSSQEKERLAFFSAFYFMINMGSMLSTFLTPILRADVHCIGNSCYPLAFGVSTILMFLAVAIFVSGKKYYKQVPPTGNLFGQVVRCVGLGIKMRIRHGKYQNKDKHWLNYAEGKYEESFVEDVKALLRVLWLFLPLPLFWALFDQQGSRWTLQAVEMKGDVGSLGRIKPDQLQVINPLLILLLIPVFERVVYPCLNKFHIPNRPLQRMCAGMAFCSAAFVVAGFVQLKMDSLHESPLQGDSGLTFINTIHCSLHIESDFHSLLLPPYEASSMIRTAAGNKTVTLHCEKEGNSSQTTISLQLMRSEAYRVIIHEGEMKELTVFQFPDKRKKDPDGKATVSLISVLDSPHNMTVWMKLYKNNRVQEQGSLNVSFQDGGASEFVTLEPGQYQLFYNFSDLDSFNETLIPVEPILNFGTGSVQTVVLIHSQSSGPSLKVVALHYVSLKENELSMAWLIPQYFIITIGEILFSITGLAFAYSQAPASMKSILQAAWHLCVAVGDLVVIIVAETQLMPSQSAEFFMFAAIMGIDTVLFVVMATMYRSRPQTLGDEVLVDTTSLINSNTDNGDIQLLDSPAGKKD